MEKLLASILFVAGIGVILLNPLGPAAIAMLTVSYVLWGPQQSKK